MNWIQLKALLAMAPPPQQGTQPNPKAELLKMVGLIAFMGFVMYFIMIRPQRQRQKQLETLVKSIRPGDKVITSSGVVGVVISVKEKTLTLRSADTKLEVLKTAVSEVTEKSGESSSRILIPYCFCHEPWSSLEAPADSLHRRLVRVQIYPPTGRNLVDVFMEKSYKHDEAFTNILDRLKVEQKDHPGRAYGNLYAAIGSNDITRYFPEFETKGEKEPTTFILNHLQRDAAGRIKLGLDLQGGSSFLVEMQTNKLNSATDKNVALANAVEVLRRRVDRFGVAEPLLQTVPGQNRILIQMPGLTEDVKDNVRRVIQQAAFLEFRMVNPDSDQLLKEGIIPPGYEIKKEVRTLPNGEKALYPFLVSKKPVSNLSGKNIASAMVVRRQHERAEDRLQARL